MISLVIPTHDLKAIPISDNIIVDFIYFLEETCDESTLSIIKTNHQHVNLSALINKYGTPASPDVVNIVASILGISTQVLIENFINYLQNLRINYK